MGELSAGPVQRLLGELAMRHVLNRANEHGSTLDLLNDVGDGVQMLDDTSGSHDPEYEVDVATRAAALDYRIIQRQVFGVDDVSKFLDRNLTSGLELADSVKLLGPDVVLHHHGGPQTARPAQTPSFAEEVVSP